MKFFGNLLFFSLFCSLSIFSQTNFSLSGVLIDKANNDPILAATVELLQAKDSAYVDGAISNAKGEFVFRNLKANNYILKVTYVGYLPFYKNTNLNGNNTNVRLGELFLETNEVLLKEAIVEGKRPEIIVKNDTLEYDAKSYKTEDNAVVEDLLKKMPGMEVDKDGKVTAQGKAVNKFFVNGKEFFADDPQVTSKNLPADMVEKVQVYDRKSEMARMTGFDDGDEETVINLTVRSSLMQGTIGTIQLGAGRDVQTDKDLRYSESAFVSHQAGGDRYTLIARANNNNNMGGADMMGGSSGGGGGRGFGGGGGGYFGTSGITKSQTYMLNINKEFSPKLNINGDIRYGKQERNTLSEIIQTTFSKKINQEETIRRDNYTAGDYVSSNFRVDWNPNKQNTVIFRPNIRFNGTDRSGTEFDHRINQDTRATLLDSKALTSAKGNTFGFGGTLDYSFKFPKEGRVFSISMRGNYNNNYSQPKNKTYYPDSLTNEYSVMWKNQHAENESLTDSYRATLSFVEPIGKNNFIQLLYRYSYSETDSRNATYNIWDYVASTGMPLDGLDTAIIVPNQSRTTLRNTIEQRIGINFKAERKKYSLTFGFNIDPTNATNNTYQPQPGMIPNQLLPSDFTGKLPVVKGDTLISSIPTKVVNFSPTVNFRYTLGQRSSLRITYEGETDQPTPDQLRDYSYTDINRPNDETQGNPNLKPSYTNNFRAEFSKFVPKSQLMYSFRMNGNFVINDIISLTQIETDGKNRITYKNINGNWNTFLMGMINAPLNKKLSLGNSVMTILADNNSFLEEQKNTMKSRMVSDNLNFKFQPNDNLYVGMNGTMSFNTITYSSVPKNNQKIYNYGLGVNVLWSFLPKWTFESDINRNWRSGYHVGYNIPQTLWNATLTRQLFSKQFGTGSIKLQIFDILQDRKSVYASQTASNLQFSHMNVIPSYFMTSFVFRFSIFPQSSFLKEGDMAPRRDDMMRPGGERHGDGGERRWYGGGRSF